MKKGLPGTLIFAIAVLIEMLGNAKGASQPSSSRQSTNHGPIAQAANGPASGTVPLPGGSIKGTFVPSPVPQPCVDTLIQGNWNPMAPVLPRAPGCCFPAIGLMKRYFPYPDPDDKALPRCAMLDVFVPFDARLFVDGQAIPTPDGFYRFDSLRPLVPGIPYIHEIRVERISPSGVTAVREIDVYLRMGRRTELTFF